MRSLSSCSDRGTSTAELAIGIPAVLGIVGIALGAIRWGMDGVTATSVAIESAYSVTRGESQDDVLDRARQALPGARWTLSHSAGQACVTAMVDSPIPLIPSNSVTQCATE